jgi:aldehyde:ferredoxin oxidoreductase
MAIMKRIVRVNMATHEVKEEGWGSYEGLGGRALTSRIVSREVPPTCHPLGVRNKLVLAPGLLAGTSAANSGRLSAGAKSPLTLGIKESNAGGTAAHKLGNLGIAAIVIEGKASEDQLYALHVSTDGVRLTPATSLKGRNNYDTVEVLTREHGDKVSYITIGKAGEMQLAAASIAVTDRENRPTRHCGRGGLGAVMGSKGLKAVIVDDKGTKKTEPSNPDAFKEAAKKFVAALQEHEVTGTGLPTYGTNILANIINESGGYPTRGFSHGQFEETQAISGEVQHDTIIKRGGKIAHPCMPGCVIRCSRIYHDEEGKYLTKGPEYETVWAHGANCGIGHLDAIAYMDRLDDDIGLDTIEMGVTLSVAMEAGLIAYGDAKAAIELLKQVGEGTPLGRIIGSGAEITGKVFGVTRVPTVKGQALPAYDPRPIQGIGVTYATSPMGADHTAGYSIAQNILKVGGHVDPLKPEGQVELSRNLQIATAAIDSTGLCLFVAFPVLENPAAFDAIYQMINALYGLNLTGDDITKMGQEILRTERDFNARAGFTSAHDRLPEFFLDEKLPPHNTVFSVSDEELDQLFNF